MLCVPTDLAVSIHAPRAGRDICFQPMAGRPSCFNPRAPRGTRLSPPLSVNALIVFQSTRPARDATPGHVLAVVITIVSIHAPRAGRDPAEHIGLALNLVSIHAPRAGRDSAPNRVIVAVAVFQSTRPARDATRGPILVPGQVLVSIHAPRAGRDTRDLVAGSGQHCFNPRAPRGTRRYTPRRPWSGWSCFNPRAPRGTRPWPLDTPENCISFQSTRPARDATRRLPVPEDGCAVSIHAPRAGRDSPNL